VFVGWLLVSFSLAQAQTLITVPGEEGGGRIYPKGVTGAQIVHAGKVAAEQRIDWNEDLRVIVQFQTPPLSVASGVAKNSARAVLESEHAAFRSQVIALGQTQAEKHGAARVSAGTVFGREYVTALNAIALTSRRWLIERIKHLQSVREVFPDVKVSTMDTESNQIIGADRVQTDLGYTGAGIVVAIIDTGVNYLHPDLGGGFGPGFKVIGGYDFENNDSDPMDDNWHGTHVAGIAAGEGDTVRGVAPGAMIRAYKVLDENGSGDISNVIAGIERAMDPDEDARTDDAVDVINMSLGAVGNPDDAASQAVDNAVAAGIVVVVAAGNSANYQTINSPGTARCAITVGASDAEDHIATFSSRGPNASTLGIKPDVVAPGVLINAPWIGGGYARRSGTSMATPQVVGAAALLLEAHPDWTPELVKQALMQHAVDLGEDVWTQGSGRIDVLASIENQAALTVSLLDFGMVETETPVWTRTDTLSVENLADEPQSFFLNIDAPSVAGISVSVAPTLVTVAPGATASISVSISVDNDLTPFSDLPPPINGRLEISSVKGIMHVPFVALKVNQLQLTFDQPPFLLALLRPDEATFLAPAINDAVLVQAGTYDLLALFQEDEEGEPARRSVVIREGITVAGATPVSISSLEAIHTVSFDMRGADGQSLSPTFDYEAWDEAKNDFSILLVSDPRYDELRTNTLSSDYTFHRMVFAYDDPSEADYILPFQQSGITGSIVLANDPAQFRRVEYSYAVDKTTTTLAFVDVQEQRLGIKISHYDLADQLLKEPFTRTVYLMPEPSETFSFPAIFQEVYDLTDGGEPGLVSKDNLRFTTAALEPMATKTNIYRQFGGVPDDALTSSTILQAIGTAPPFWSGEMMEFVRDRIYFGRAPFFFNPLYDSRSARTDYSLLTVGEIPLVEEDGSLINNRVNSLESNIFFNPGAHELIWTFDGYKVDGLTGLATARILFDSNVQFREPSNLQRLEITQDGVVRDVLDPLADNRVLFQAKFDDVTAALLHRKLGDTAWESLSLTTLSPGLFEAVLPPTLKDGFHALRITLTNPDGGILDYTVDPGFRWGQKDVAINRMPTAALPLKPEDGIEVDPALADPLLFAWTRAFDPDSEDVLRYVIDLSGPGLDTTLTVRTDTTAKFDVRPRLLPGATYTWTLRTTDGYAEVMAPNFTFHVATVTGTEAVGDAPPTFRLHPNYPNPFGVATAIEFDLPVEASVDLSVYDVLGRRIARLASGRIPAGRHQVRWDAARLAGGVYFYRLRAGAFNATRRMVLMR